MSVLLLTLGVVVVVGTTIDALWTTIWVEGHAGPMSGRGASLLDRILRRALGRFGHGALMIKGPVVLSVAIGSWVLLLWAGWTLIFSSVDGAVVDATTRATAGLVERIYFVGYTIFTLGNGDYAPAGSFFRVATAVASMNGLVLVTLVVTYLLSVIEAVVAGRSFAGQVYALGRSPEEFVRAAWDGRGFPLVELQLFSLVEQLNRSTEQHQAYPMLHYFHAREDRRAIASAVVIFDEALLLLTEGVAPERRPSISALRIARRSVAGYLDALQSAYMQPAEDNPRSPDLALLADVGIPTVAPGDFGQAVAAHGSRRRLLHALVTQEHRDWPEARVGESMHS